MQWLFGFGAIDFVALVLREILGAFFVLYRFRWVYDPSDPACEYWFCRLRRQKLIDRLATCGYGTHPAIAGTVAIGETAAGLGLMVGLFTVVAAAGLVVILTFAIVCTARDQIAAYHPVDKIDCVSCYMFQVEPVYYAMSFLIIAMGPGRYSLDWLLWGVS